MNLTRKEIGCKGKQNQCWQGPFQGVVRVLQPHGLHTPRYVAKLLVLQVLV